MKNSETLLEKVYSYHLLPCLVAIKPTTFFFA
jgi:hypothetical protein